MTPFDRSELRNAIAFLVAIVFLGLLLGLLGGCAGAVDYDDGDPPLCPYEDLGRWVPPGGLADTEIEPVEGCSGRRIIGVRVFIDAPHLAVPLARELSVKEGALVGVSALYAPRRGVGGFRVEVRDGSELVGFAEPAFAGGGAKAQGSIRSGRARMALIGIAGSAGNFFYDVSNALVEVTEP